MNLLIFFIKAIWEKLAANEELVVNIMSYLKKKELKPLFCSAKCFSFDNDNAWGILWKAKFHSWKKPPEQANMTWRKYYHFTMQYEIDKSEEFLNDAENFLACRPIVLLKKIQDCMKKDLK